MKAKENDSSLFGFFFSNTLYLSLVCCPYSTDVSKFEKKKANFGKLIPFYNEKRGATYFS